MGAAGSEMRDRTTTMCSVSGSTVDVASQNTLVLVGERRYKKI